MDTRFYDDKKDGELITQIQHFEFSDLITKMFDEKLDLDILLMSGLKKEQMLAKKLACLMQLAAQDMPAFLVLPKTDWITLYFRKRGFDGMEAELSLWQK